jgi:hypothetical protein
MAQSSGPATSRDSPFRAKVRVPLSRLSLLLPAESSSPTRLSSLGFTRSETEEAL